MLFQKRVHLWVELVVGTRPCLERFFSDTPVFPSPQKPAFPNSSVDLSGIPNLHSVLNTVGT